MKPKVTNHKRGFRCSWKDLLVLGGGGALSVWLAAAEFPLWWLIPCVLLHFFLFCNVFLVWRNYEFIWAGCFVFNVALHLSMGRFDWLSPCLFQLPITLVVIVLQLRSPWYRGIFASRINPPNDG